MMLMLTVFPITKWQISWWRQLARWPVFNLWSPNKDFGKGYKR